jgi:arginine deiminase
MDRSDNALVTSEIGNLRSVLIHTPGPEVENMTPEHAERALYSDILNLSVISREYSQFLDVLNLFAKTYQIRDLLTQILSIETVKENLCRTICENEGVSSLTSCLMELPPEEVGRLLLEGVPLVKDNLTNFLSSERFNLMPLHNSFFTRDASITFSSEVIIASLASQVRDREAVIMQMIFQHHPELTTKIISPPTNAERRSGITFEGGDILVAREDVLLIGCGARTTSRGIDYLLEKLKEKDGKFHILVQTLPTHPESFIHLDMVFTLLDLDKCLIYSPVILNRHAYETVHIVIENRQVTSIREELDLIRALSRLGIELEAIHCGGDNDLWIQEREQWHSGANFLALGPGKVIGYGRNEFTFDALNQAGFEILPAAELVNRREISGLPSRFAVAVDGSELSRGGGGCRCMTMPFHRDSIS